jgi:signal transduction histidine kinase
VHVGDQAGLPPAEEVPAGSPPPELDPDDLRQVIFRRFVNRVRMSGSPVVDPEHQFSGIRLADVRGLADGIVDDVLDLAVPVLVNQAHREEGRRIARELHDEIAHGLATALLGLQLADLDLAARPENLPARLEGIRSGLRATLDDVRAMAAALRGTVGPRRLDDALRDLVEVHGTDEVELEVAASGDLELVAPRTKEEAYLIAREAVRNALLHADGVTSVRLSVQLNDRGLVVEVQDDGAGFDVESADRGRMGLTSMRERADLLDGTLTVDAESGGTRIRLMVPPVIDEGATGAGEPDPGAAPVAGAS